MAYYSLDKDVAGQWRWKFVADNHKTIAVSSESYHNRVDCIASIKLVRATDASTAIYDTSQSPWTAVQ